MSARAILRGDWWLVPLVLIFAVVVLGQHRQGFETVTLGGMQVGTREK
jgi:hypothetical protein